VVSSSTATISRWILVIWIELMPVFPSRQVAPVR
jgi:hypothetical protein